MNKMIGIMTAWYSEIFIEAAIKQALYMCDEVLISIAPHSEAMRKFGDGTLEIAKKYKDRVKLIDIPTYEFCSKTKPLAMNKMIENSDLWDVGNWFCLLDVDEFWFKKDIDKVKEFLHTTDANWVWNKTKYFMINMQNYMMNEEGRFWRILDKNTRFKYSNQWQASREPSVHMSDDIQFYHYSALLNPYAKIAFWETDWPGPPPAQREQTEWVKKIYLNYDLNNQEYWVEENRKLYGAKQPFWRSDYKPNENGTLYKYDGKHPEWIEELNISHIEDFRKLYWD